MKGGQIKDVRTAIVTGANVGIGRVTAIELAKSGYHVILASRSPERTKVVVDEITSSGGSASFVQLELGSFDSVRRAARVILEQEHDIALLVNNAGLGDYGSLTESGFERCWGVNYLGPFLFTNLLLDQLIASAPSRIINVSSVMHFSVKRLQLDNVQRPSWLFAGFRNYNRSKLGNVLFTTELRSRLSGTGVTACAIEPGGTVSNGYRNIPQPFRWFILRSLQSTEDGAATTLHAARDVALTDECDHYYAKSAPKTASKLARDSAAANDLWTRSERWIRGIP